MNLFLKHWWIYILPLLFLNSKCKDNFEPYYETKIYPNPFKESLTLECSYYDYPKPLKLELHGNFNGKSILVFEDTLKYSNQKFKISVPRSSPQQILGVLSIGSSFKKYTLQQQ